ncbi:ankyrin repeat domain-containing protein [Leptothoe sp. LEGE 181152]|nr:ankyrin repeat domain-containing protein [Leptothoe sp. LEGE 181152]
MGYFEKIANQYFEEDLEGNKLFYRQGIWFLIESRYYIVPDENKELELRRFLILYHQVLAIVVSIALIFFCIFTDIDDNLLLFFPGVFILCFPFQIWHYLSTVRLIKNLAVSSKQKTLKEKLGKLPGPRYLSIALGCWSVFLGFSAVLTDISQWDFGVMLILMGVYLLAYTGYQVKLNEISNPNRSSNLRQLWVGMLFSFAGFISSIIFVVYRPHAWPMGLSLIISCGSLCLFIGYWIQIKNRTHRFYLKCLLALGGALSLIYPFSVINIPFLEGRGVLKYVGLYPKQQNCESGKALGRYLSRGGSLKTQVSTKNIHKQLYFQNVGVQPKEIATRSILECALQYGDREAAVILLSQGIDLHARATIGGNFQATWLHFAVARNDIEVIETLIAEGVDINTASDNYGSSPLQWAVIFGSGRATAERLINHDSQIDPGILSHITYRTNPEVVDFLVDEGADINFRDQSGLTPLHRVAKSHNIELSERLLAHGANANAKTSQGSTKGSTPLHLALSSFEIRKPLSKSQRRQVAQRRAQDFAKFLAVFLEYGADINAQKDNGATLVHTATAYTSTDRLQQILDHGADPNIPRHSDTSEFVTPLQQALVGTLWEKAEVLINAGADVNIPTTSGDTPLTVFRANRNANPYHQAPSFHRFFRRMRSTQRVENLLLENGAK